MNLSDLTNDPRGIVKMTVEAATTAGDLGMNTEGGVAVVPSSNLPISVVNNATAGASAVRAMAQVEPTNPSLYGRGGNMAKNMALLGNGNVAEVYTGDGSSTATNSLNLRVKSPLGADLSGRIVVSTDTGPWARIAKLNSTQFVIVWATSASVIKFAIYNNDYTQAVAPVTVGTATSGATYTLWNFAVNAAGQIVIAYSKVTSNNLVFARYDATGTLQGSEATVEAGATPACIAVLGCANGDFVILYYRQAATTAYKFARYNSSGVIVGSLTNVVTTTSQINTGDFSQTICELVGGNISLSVAGASDGSPDVYIYSSTNTLVSTINFGTSTANPLAGVCATLVPFGSGFAVFALVTGGAKTAMWVFDASGNPLLGKTLVGGGNGIAANSAATGSGVGAFVNGQGGFSVFRSAFDSTNYNATFFVIDAAGNLIGSEIVLKTSDASAAVTDGCIVRGALGIAAIGFTSILNSMYVQDGFYNTQRRSILGAALDTVAAGAQCRFATKGSYTLNANYGMGGQFDQRSASVPGTRGTVIGNSAVLLGMAV